MQIKTFEDLIALLNQENVTYRADANEKLVVFAVRSGPLNTEMVIRWEQALMLSQFIIAFPLEVPFERMPVIEHTVTVINHRLIMPGFGMNPDARIIYYRLVVPRGEDGSLSSDYIQRLIATAVDTMIDFFELLVRVVRDGANPDQLLSELAPRLAMPPGVRSGGNA
jgi:hypothetical protein